MHATSFRTHSNICPQNCSRHYVPKVRSRRTCAFESLLKYSDRVIFLSIIQMVEVTIINILVAFIDSIFASFQHFDLVLFIASNGGGRCLPHWTDKSYMQNGMCDRWQIIYTEKEKTLGWGWGNSALHNCCCLLPCNLYCRVIFTVGLWTSFQTHEYKTSDEKRDTPPPPTPPQQQLLGKAVHHFTHCVRNSCMVLCQVWASQSKWKRSVQ